MVEPSCLRKGVEPTTKFFVYGPEITLLSALFTDQRDLLYCKYWQFFLDLELLQVGVSP